ncbi:MAG: sigma-70 family RNA polymerase sigma factor [Acidimicrobiales bacterium]
MVSDDPTTSRRALEALYRDRYEPSVRLAHLLVGDRARAEELAQDAFVRMLPRLDGVGDPAAYLRTVLVNLCRDASRRSTRARALRAEGTATAAPPDVPVTSTAVWQALQRLPERQRLAVCLRFYDDLPDDRIAELLGVRPATVRSLVHRGLAALKEVVPRG